MPRQKKYKFKTLRWLLIIFEEIYYLKIKIIRNKMIFKKLQSKI